MKKLLSMLLMLAMLLGLSPAALADVAEPAPALPDGEELEAEPDRAALPAVGDVVHGFEVIEQRDYALIDAVVVRFEHQKTGAELYYIANDDTNRAFDLVFFTDAIDNTGLPHVFEHATTAGSEKYPSTSLWFNLSYQTYVTFINAQTGPRMTHYPIASLSEAQLLKLADFYTDSCFHPILMDVERIFRTEAWRYRMEDPDAPLTIEGTVYSEMQGAQTIMSAGVENMLRATFPGSMIGNNCGGDPDCIPDMTWEMLKNYHELYYHPSNCVAYLYGRFEDYAAFLELLDGYFSQYEKREFTHSDDGYTPITEPVVQSVPFALEQGANTDCVSQIFYSFVCPGLNESPEQEVILNTLTDLLTDEASAMQQSLQQAIPYGNFGAYIEMNGPEDIILFQAANVNPEDAETFKATVDAALADVAENGFPQDQLDGVMTRLEISALLSRESSSPVDSVINRMASMYAATGDPWSMQAYQESLFRMDEWNRQGLYAKAVSDWLAGSRTTSLVTTYPEPGAKETHDAALAEKLAQIKAGMTDEEIAAIVEESNAAPVEDDASALVAQLQAVTVASLPEELKRYEFTDETDAEGVRHIDVRAGVSGIGQASVLLDAAGLAQEDIHWFSLFAQLIGKLDTRAHTKAELARLTGRYLYSPGFYLSLPGTADGGYHPYLQLLWIGLDEDLDEGYDLVRELVFDTKLDDPAKLMEQVQALKADLKSSITTNAATVLACRALAATEESYRYNAYAAGLDFYAFLGEVETLLEEDPDAAVAKLQGVQAYFNNRANAVTLFAGNEASIALNRGLADAFLASLDRREIAPATYDLPVPAPNEALIMDSSVQYNLMLADFDALEREGFTGDLSAVCNAVSDICLIPLLRDEYGVYTPQSGVVGEDGVFVYAYRDPNIAETFAVYDQLGDLVADMDVDQQTLDGYILSAYSDYAMPKGELSGALETAVDVLEGHSPDRALEWMRQLKQVTPQSVRDSADMFAKLSDNGLRKTAGSAAAINANADLYDAILNPFGAVDATQIEFTDAAEGGEHYEAVRFAFEQGLMDPVAGDVFGVDEPATVGDLLTAMYVLAGGTKDAEEALAAFAGYGLAPADADLAAPIAPTDFWDLASALVGETVEPLVETADPAAVTRGELAGMLKALTEE